jgi:hypothetical protein
MIPGTDAGRQGGKLVGKHDAGLILGSGAQLAGGFVIKCRTTGFFTFRHWRLVRKDELRVTEQNVVCKISLQIIG